MAVERLTEDDGPIFGRAEDLAELDSRVREHAHGLTVLAGRPQQGKSRLLRQFVDNLRADSRHLVGFARATADTTDAAVRTLQDFYVSWLSDANYRQQARSL
jgi:replicative DNA helicase